MLWKVVDRATGVALLSFVAGLGVATAICLFVPIGWGHLEISWLIIFIVVVLIASPVVARLRKQRLPWAYLAAAALAFPAVIGAFYLTRPLGIDEGFAPVAGIIPYFLAAYLIERRPEPVPF